LLTCVNFIKFFEKMGMTGFDRLYEIAVACRGFALASQKNVKHITAKNIGKVIGAQFAMRFAAMCATPAMAA